MYVNAHYMLSSINGLWPLILFREATENQTWEIQRFIFSFNGLRGFGMLPDNPGIICDRIFNSRWPKSWSKWKVPNIHVFPWITHTSLFYFGAFHFYMMFLNYYYHGFNGRVTGRRPYNLKKQNKHYGSEQSKIPGQSEFFLGPPTPWEEGK